MSMWALKSELCRWSEVQDGLRVYVAHTGLATILGDSRLEAVQLFN